MRTLADFIANGIHAVGRRYPRARRRQLVSYRFDERRAMIMLSPQQDHDALPNALTSRDDGDPTVTSGDVDMRYLIGPVFRAGRSRAWPHYPGASRVLVEIDLRGATAWDGCEVEILSEHALREGSPAAVELLRRLRRTGADLVWVAADDGATVAVIFVAALGDTIPVLSRELAVRDDDGRWREDEAADRRPGWHPILALHRFAKTFGVLLSAIAVSLAVDAIHPWISSTARTLASAGFWLVVTLSTVTAIVAVATAGWHRGDRSKRRAAVEEPRLEPYPLPPQPRPERIRSGSAPMP